MIINSKIIGSNISYEVYSRQEPDVSRGGQAFSMSRGELVNFYECPARWLAGYRDDDKETDATTWGSMVDCLLMSRNEFDLRYAVSAPTYFKNEMKCPSCGSVTDSKSCRKCKCDREPVTTEKPWDSKSTMCKEWEESQGGKIIIKSELFEAAEKAVAAIRNNALVSELFDESDKQVLVCGLWQDEDTGLKIPLRGLLDIVPPKDHALFGKWLADFKTARNGNPAQWADTVNRRGYDVQAALYMDLYTSATNEDRVDFVHVVQENVFPFHVVSPPMALSAEFMQWGRGKYQRALRQYCQCLKTGVWPSFNQIGIAFGQTQIIGPDDLWAYKSCAGATEFKMPKAPTPQPSSGIDLIP